ncbi:MAG TPA: response regulator [Myxococcaceae bacterium]|nr:response regulator [Myxococcaceae bacterium]
MTSIPGSTAARVLVVDGGLTVRMQLSDALESTGLPAATCASAREARELVGRGTFSLLVIGEHLSDGEGLELLRELRADERTRGVPALLLMGELPPDHAPPPGSAPTELMGRPYELSQLVTRALALAAVTVARPSARVLVIDDSATFRGVLHDVLSAAGYSVSLATTGEEGLRLAAALRPDAVVVDWHLPGIDGTAVVRRIRMDPALRRTPCLLWTASERMTNELGGLEAGADAYLLKDAEVGVLLARLESLLRTTAGPTAIRAEPAMGPKRLLTVDDSPTFQQAMAEELRREAYEVLTAGSGEEALGKLETEAVDCVLLDSVMPGLSGLETCRRIKASPRWRGLSVLLLSAEDDAQAMISAFAAGADDYVVKADEFETLKGRLRALLRRKSAEDEHRRVQEELLRRELEAQKARAAMELAETRAALLADLEKKNAELARAHQALLETQRQKEELTSYIVHDLKSPLTVILGNARLIEHAAADAAMVEEMARSTVNASVTMNRMIMNLLDISKAEEGTLVPKRAPVDVAQLCRDVCQALAYRAAEKNQKLEANVEELPERVFPLDADLLRRVLENLVDNCLKYTPAGGTIRLEASGDGSRSLELRVRDEGPGIPESFRDRIFDRYTQLERDAGTYAQSSRGLGLAFCRLAVEAHGGTIRAEPNEPKGSLFRVTLPVA